jgi:hypothetical protein
MKIFQKLEVLTGISTFLLVFPNIYLTYISFAEWIRISKISSNDIIIPAFISLIIPSLLLAVNACWHSTRNSKIGFIILFVCGSFLTITHLLSWLIGSAFNGNRLLGLSPGFFAFVTVVLAIYNSITTYRNNNLL